MRVAVVALALFASFVPAFATANPTLDPLTWLGKIATAGQRLNYTGTFIYQSGGDFETSRIAHMVDAEGEHERLEVLDGSPREVIRTNDEVLCVLPDQKTVIVDRAGGRRAFPARLPASYTGVAENYRVSLGDASRVAGHDTRLIMLEPKDDLRYGHMLWAETTSGLLLKARTLDERGDVVEQFTFSDVRIGGDIDPEMLRPQYEKNENWRVVNAHGSELRASDSEWSLANPLPGYSLKSAVRRPLGRDRGDVLHLVYGDGLASISVFIEPIDPQGGQGGLGLLASGAINIYKRTVNGHLVTVLGEVPLRAVQWVGDGMQAVQR
ncbi:MAG: MucB/RseB C-terminal domain-containing protein [Rhodocyclaceae bacterium]